jgi:hypothetical protein
LEFFAGDSDLEPRSPFSGTSRQEFPKRRISVHIRTYRLTIRFPGTLKSPCKRRFLHRKPQSALVVAMQKVVGSNPISRFL